VYSLLTTQTKARENKEKQEVKPKPKKGAIMSGQIEQMNIFILLVASILCAFFYFLPAIIGRKKKNAGTIFLCNLLFGCTGVGWVVCLIWALSRD